MNIGEALALGRGQLSDADDPALDARILLQYVLESSHSYLIANREERLSPAQEDQYLALLARGVRREPVPYLTGVAPFFGRDFYVNPAVLIPRPETELLVEAALEWAGLRKRLHLVDVGTGCGCIAITMAKRLPAATVEAVDISPAALEIAGRNAREHDVANRVLFRSGRLLESLSHHPDLIVANLPYVADHEWTALDDGVKWYEPEIALRGGPDGLALIHDLLKQASSRLAPGGAIFLEIGWQQGQSALRLARSFFPEAEIDLKPDYAGRDRVVSIELVLYANKVVRP
jgi:release factor glutamine methyltransferase